MRKAPEGNVQVLQLVVEIINWNETIETKAVNQMVLGKFAINEVGVPVRHYNGMRIRNDSNQVLDPTKTMEQNQVSNHAHLRIDFKQVCNANKPKK